MSNQRPVPVNPSIRCGPIWTSGATALWLMPCPQTGQDHQSPFADPADAERSTGVALRDGGPMPWQKDLPQRAPNQRVMNLLIKERNSGNCCSTPLWMRSSAIS